MPQTIDVATARPYRVHVGPGLLGRVAGEAAAGRTGVAVLSDSNVAPLYGAALEDLDPSLRLEVPAGEGSKELGVLGDLLERMAAAGLDRGSLLVALGGGVVGDLGGLAAALYMRGIDCVQCPTSLLAQVDSSVGGKTAVNLAAGKNLAGTFHQPLAVYADTATLATLPPEEFRSGLGEVVKTALLAGEPLLGLLEREAPRCRPDADPELLTRVVSACVAHKSSVVAADEREGGPRKSLNLGHTFAHAIERAAGYGTIPHGLAVAAGLGLAARLGRTLGLLTEPALPERIDGLLAALGLPRNLAELQRRHGLRLEPGPLEEAMRRDKKSAGGELQFVIPVEVGRVALDVRPPPEALRDLLERETGEPSDAGLGSHVP